MEWQVSGDILIYGASDKSNWIKSRTYLAPCINWTCVSFELLVSRWTVIIFFGLIERLTNSCY